MWYFVLIIFNNNKEANTAFDFDKITQLLVSDPIKCVPKDSFYYVNVILLPAKGTVGLILPYVYQKNEKNDLKNWIFINNQFKR